MEQKEFVLRIILFTGLILLSLISITLILGGASGFSVTIPFVDIIVAYVVILIGLYLLSREKVIAVQYLLISYLLLLGAFHTVIEGFAGLYVYYYIVALLFSFMLLEQRRFTLFLIISTPVVVYIIGFWNVGIKINDLLIYLGFTLGFGILLAVYQRINETFQSERMLVQEVETIQQAGASVISTLDLRETITRILDQLTTIIPHDSASVMLLEDDGYLEIVGGRGWENPEDVLGIRFAIPGENPNSIVIETGKPYVLGNAPNQFPEFTKPPHNHIFSWLGIPLIRDGSIIGMMAIDSVEPNHFSNEHIRILSSFADYVSIAMDNARLYQVARKSVQRRAILHQASQDVIRASADLEEIYKAIYTAAIQLMPCDAFLISLLEEDVYEIVYVIVSGQRQDNVIIPFGAGLSGKVIGSGRSILAEDLDKFETNSYVKISKRDVRSLIAVPLRIGSDVIGMISAQSFSKAEYSEEDLKLLELLASNAAIAIKNSQLLAEVEHLARSDSLTGVLNRRAFDELLDQQLSNAARYNFPIGLLMIDIDDFKQFNDTYGHNVGDERLKIVANLIQENVRLTDFVARIGGEEFTVILPHTGNKGAVRLAERIRNAVLREFQDSDDPGGTVSVGVAIYPYAADDLKSLYIAADRAMFDAKRKGKNQVVAMIPEVDKK